MAPIKTPHTSKMACRSINLGSPAVTRIKGSQVSLEGVAEFEVHNIIDWGQLEAICSRFGRLKFDA